jgi:hypothetical protein
MPKSKLVLDLHVLGPDTDLNSVMIGNSRYCDDIWDLSPFIPAKTYQESRKYLRFQHIKNAELQKTTKQYAYYKLGKINPKSVIGYIHDNLSVFDEYCSLNGIRSFADITHEIFLNYNIWLKEEKKYAVSTGFKMCYVLEEIIKIGQIKGWDVPQVNVLKGITSNTLWNLRKNRTANKTKPIPQDVFDKIIYYSVHKEKDILTKAGIIIQSQTGLRINEVLSIEVGCVKTTADGYDYMEVTLGKTEKGEPIIHKVFINKLVKDVIAELTEVGDLLRKESGLKELFIHRKSGIIRISNPATWCTKSPISLEQPLCGN